MNSSFFKNLFSDIRFWIGFLFGIRLIGISNAPLETGHNWRQAFTNMITRNYVKHGFDLLHPQIDMAGNKTGYVGSEFPIFNFFSYIFSSIFQYEHWHGRLINLLFTSLGLYFFYKLIKAQLEEKIAFSSTLILGVSIWFGYGRKIMPDTFSVSLVIIGLWFGYNYLLKGKWYQLLLYFVLITFGILSKIPSIFLLSSFIVLPLLKSIPLYRKSTFIISTCLAVSIVFLWYFYWVPELLIRYHFQLFIEKSFLEGLNEIRPLIPQLLERFYYSAFQSFFAFFAFIAGIFYFFKDYPSNFKLVLISVSLLFFAFIIKTGAVFPHHNYYIIPFVPVMAVLAGIAISQLPKKVFPFALLLIGIEGIANQQHGFFIADSKKYKLKLENYCDQFIATDELIIINGGASHQPIYFANRKGWTIHNHQLINPKYIDSLIDLGAKKLIVDKHMIKNYQPSYSTLLESEDYFILDLKE